jgi:hypothetical protein
MISVNNKIFCEAYSGGKSLKSEVKSGFATIQQKNNLVGLRVLADATVAFGTKTLDIPKGSVVFFNEETLYIHQQYHAPIKNNVFDEPCVVADFNHVIGVKIG